MHFCSWGKETFVSKQITDYIILRKKKKTFSVVSITVGTHMWLSNTLLKTKKIILKTLLAKTKGVLLHWDETNKRLRVYWVLQISRSQEEAIWITERGMISEVDSSSDIKRLPLYSRDFNLRLEQSESPIKTRVSTPSLCHFWNSGHALKHGK